jgi:hypothetical protein
MQITLNFKMLFPSLGLSSSLSKKSSQKQEEEAEKNTQSTQDISLKGLKHLIMRNKRISNGKKRETQSEQHEAFNT